MNIIRDKELEASFAKQIAESFDRPLIRELDRSPQSIRTGSEVHLSDLLAIRQTFFRRTAPKPTEITEALYYLAGRGHEDVFGRISGFTKAAPRFVAGISYSPDFRWNGIPTEFKTRRRNLAKVGEETDKYAQYLEQLKGYCCLDNITMGVLVVLSLLEGQRGDPLNPTKPELAVYSVCFDQAELDDFRRELEDRRTRLLEALQTGDFAGLPLCDAWKCGTPVKSVRTPPRCITCDRDFEGQWGLNKHLTSRTGRGHEYKNEEVSWNYIPRCKWYAECQPQSIDPKRGGDVPSPRQEERATEGE